MDLSAYFASLNLLNLLSRMPAAVAQGLIWGLMALGVEYCMDRFFRAAWQPTWSLVVVVICVGLIIPLRIVRRVPSLREEARRRFNM